MKGGKSSSKAKNADRSLSVRQKKGKDPNKPKRPPSAFFVFLEEFRKQYKEQHPNNKSVAAVAKASGEKWKTMSDADKAPYVEKAEKKKEEYEKQMQSYNRKQSGGAAGDDDSDKSRSEVHDGEDDAEDDEEEDDE